MNENSLQAKGWWCKQKDFKVRSALCPSPANRLSSKMSSLSYLVGLDWLCLWSPFPMAGVACLGSARPGPLFCIVIPLISILLAALIYSSRLICQNSEICWYGASFSASRWRLTWMTNVIQLPCSGVGFRGKTKSLKFELWKRSRGFPEIPGTPSSTQPYLTSSPPPPSFVFSSHS